MKQLYEDLWVSTPELSACETESEWMMHGFLLQHERGNMLISRVENADDHQTIAGLGGIIRHYLSGWQEAGPGARQLQQRFNSALYCHTRALGPVSAFVEADDTFNLAEVHCGSFHLVPTPGHTPGSTTYLYASPFGKTYLFVGGTLVRDGNRWVTLQLPESNEADLHKSLEFYRALRPDVVLMSVTRGHPGWCEVTVREWLALLDEAEHQPRDCRQRVIE
ncbi:MULTISPECIES: MBL fold metallo-hydrolase [unclassified Erwinia]|uniref:MBL fold metallo-hydrolase n=1 Tax=unclassified Erwinia TaxID=2622719 RepID=UPI0008356E1F|nr:MBL fold metallo-hydrolase [Erwinia sp. ErVv1]